MNGLLLEISTPLLVTIIILAVLVGIVILLYFLKATVSGIYVTSVKGLRGSSDQNRNVKKKGKFKQFVEKLQEKAGAKPVK